MVNYYLDIETNTEGRKRPDPFRDKIQTIQYQRIDDKGFPRSELTVLHAHQTSEKKILEKFLNKTGWNHKKPRQWDFVPVGCNLNYDLSVIYSEAKKLLNIEIPIRFILQDLPTIDIKPFLIVANGNRFKGSSLDKFSKKTNSGKFASKLIEEKKWDKLTKYIVEEAESFLDLFQFLSTEQPILFENYRLTFERNGM